MKVVLLKMEEKREVPETVDEGERKCCGRTVMVGVRLDDQSNQLLTWSLNNVAEAGDRVVALHVLSKSCNSDDLLGNSPSSVISIARGFESMLRTHEDYCHSKQINLKLKLIWGSSIRRVLVGEAKLFCASKVIVGVTKNNVVIGSFSNSVAQYCAKKIPVDCWVAAVSNGKIVFQKVLQKSNHHQSKAGDTNNERLIGNDSKYSNRTKGALPSTSKLKTCSICSMVSKEYDDKEDNFSMEVSNTLNSTTSLAQALPETKQTLFWRIIHGRITKTVEKSMMPVSKLPSTSPVVNADEEEIWKFYNDLEILRQKYSSTFRMFSYEELLNATSDFSTENLVGKGGNSHVYRGYFPGGKELAVKVLKKNKDLVKEFLSEIEIITTVNHKNIICLVGFCFEKNQNLLLVYDMLSKGSLEQNLHGRMGNVSTLNWAERYRVAIGVAEALCYLHYGGSGQCVIHRDVKSSNILLSDDFEPKLSDFGLASWTSPSMPHIIGSDVSGTFGYIAPECLMFGMVNEKTDVYAFGVVLLELLSGRKPIEDDPQVGRQSLVMWAKPFLKMGKSSLMLDSKLGDEFHNEVIERITLAASLCIQKSPMLRPSMPLILKLLEGEPDELQWARYQFKTTDEFEGGLIDEESISDFSTSDLRSHFSLALLDVEDDSGESCSVYY